ncbi:hypothetical protein SNE40_018065 [Patella caerulea]|uniref:Uncharacterized protein n=1 Tax=Patella caerulea TaxID=87958 RepID=A0AAN8JBI7_PATCE
MADTDKTDDVFDEEEDEKVVIEKEYSKVKEKLEKEGYREGLEHGHGISIQQSFNKSYRFTANKLYRLGKLKGQINAVLSIAHKKPEILNPKTKDGLEDLLSCLSQYESKLLSRLKERETARLIVNESARITDQTSSLYVEDDFSDFLGLKSDGSSESEVNCEVKDDINLCTEQTLNNTVEEISETPEDPLRDCRISTTQKQFELLLEGIDTEIAKFESKYAELMAEQF